MRCRDSSASSLLFSNARCDGSTGLRISIRRWPCRGRRVWATRTRRDPDIASGTMGTDALIAAANAPARNRLRPGSLITVPSAKNVSDSPPLAARNKSRASRALPDASNRSTNREPTRRRRKLTAGTRCISPFITNEKRGGRNPCNSTPSRMLA